MAMPTSGMAVTNHASSAEAMSTGSPPPPGSMATTGLAGPFGILRDAVSVRPQVYVMSIPQVIGDPGIE